MSDKLCEKCGKPISGTGIFLHSLDGSKSWHYDCHAVFKHESEVHALRSKCERLEKALIAIGEGNYTCEKHARCNASEKAQAALSTPSVTPTEGNEKER